MKYESLRQLALNATPGPYECCGDDRGGCFCGMIWSKEGIGSHVLTAKHYREDEDCPAPTREQAMKNMLYFAAVSPGIVVELLDRIQELEGKVAEFQQMTGLENANS
jgi:hypothetical protein